MSIFYYYIITKAILIDTTILPLKSKGREWRGHNTLQETAVPKFAYLMR
jgi:hypothetical protein